MAYEDIILEKEDGVATLTLNRPDKLNALNARILAEAINAITEVDEDDDMMKEAKEFAAKIAKGSSVAIELAKRSVYKGLENDLAAQLAHETWAYNMCQQTEDVQEGPRSFIEKRERVFKGR